MIRRGLVVGAMLLAASEARAQTCVRPTDAAGYAGYRYESPPDRFDTAGVRVWYARTGTHAVRPATMRPDGVPDDVASVGAITQDALDRFAALGFRAPLSDADTTCGSNGGDGRLDVYLVRFPAADGTAAAERCVPGATVRCATFILAEANLARHYATAEEGIRTVLPHETFHAIQNAYDANVDRYWAEGTAQWAAKLLAPQLKDLELNLPAFFAEEGRSIDLPPGGATAGYLYGAAIWPVFLTRHFDDAIVREALEAEAVDGASALDSVGAALAARGARLEDAWPMFWRWNASTGARASSGNGYPDAASYPVLAVKDLGEGVSGITAGSTGNVFRVQGPVKVTLTSSVHRAWMVPLADGAARLDQAKELPADVVSGEALVVLTSLTPSKQDAHYELRADAIAADPANPGSTGEAPVSLPQIEATTADDGGCSASGAPTDVDVFALALAALVLSRRGASRSKARAART